MSSPVYTIYNRTIKFSLILILVLSFVAALVQFLLHFNRSLSVKQQQLAMFTQQVDAQVMPVLQFAEAVKNRAQQSTQLNDG